MRIGRVAVGVVSDSCNLGLVSTVDAENPA